MLSERDLDHLLTSPLRRHDVEELVAEVRRLVEALEDALERHNEDMGHASDEDCPTCSFFADLLGKDS